MSSQDIDLILAYVRGASGRLLSAGTRHKQPLGCRAVEYKGPKIALSVRVKPLALENTCFRGPMNAFPCPIKAMDTFQPRHCTSLEPRDSGENSSNVATQARPEGKSSEESSEQSRGVRWLDREVRSGKVAKEQLVGGSNNPPPLRTDRILRSYSMAPPRRSRKWWNITALAIGGVATIASGTAVTAAGVGLLLTCIRSGTILTSCSTTFSGTKLIVTGVDMLRKARREDRTPLKRGTASRVWGHMHGIVGALTTTAAMLPLAHFIINVYSLLLRVSSWCADDVRFQLQSRKLLLHSADQVHRASRAVFGEELPQSVADKVAEAAQLAEKHFDDFRVASLSRNERNQYLAALCFKLPAAYSWCALTLVLPVAATKLVAPLVTSAMRRIPKMVHKHCIAIEDAVQGKLGRPGPAVAPFFASAGRVAALVLLTKPWGLMGERIANVPSVRLKVRPEGALRVLAGPDFPEIRLPGIQPGQLQDNDVSSVIPWFVRYFLQ